MQWYRTEPAVSSRWACVSFGCNWCASLALLTGPSPALSSSSSFLCFWGTKNESPIDFPGSPVISHDSHTPLFEATSRYYCQSYGYCCRKDKIKTLDTLERFLDLLGEARAVGRMQAGLCMCWELVSQTPPPPLSHPCPGRLPVSPDFLYVKPSRGSFPKIPSSIWLPW